MSDSKHVTYEDAGVDTAEGGRAVDAIKQMVKDTNRSEVIGGIGGFGGLFSAAALKDMEDPILISGTDGVGTKLVLAQIMDRHETVGQDLVAMCVNDILPGLRCHRSHRGRAHGKDYQGCGRRLQARGLRARGR